MPGDGRGWMRTNPGPRGQARKRLKPSATWASLTLRYPGRARCFLAMDCRSRTFLRSTPRCWECLCLSKAGVGTRQRVESRVLDVESHLTHFWSMQAVVRSIRHANTSVQTCAARPYRAQSLKIQHEHSAPRKEARTLLREKIKHARQFLCD